LLKISARFIFLKSCAVNKNLLFLPLLFSEWIPPQVEGMGEGGGFAELLLLSQHHGRSIDQTAEAEH
jgi:hypothetical protein